MGDSVQAPRSTDGRPWRERRHAAGPSVLTPPTGLPAVPDPGMAIPAQRAGSPAPPVMPPSTPPSPPDTVLEPCACGHARSAHDHYRRGNDCGACGAQVCAEFRPQGSAYRGSALRRTLRRFGAVR